MIQRHLRKLICIILCVVILCMYTVSLLHSDVTKGKSEDAATELSSSIWGPMKIQNNITEELLARGIKIKNICGNKTMTNKGFKYNGIVIRRLYIDIKHNITWCPIFKAASSTIMRIFAALGGTLSKKTELEVQKGQLQINKLARKAFPFLGSSSFKMRKIVLATNRVIVVRHPFERLLSAYRDKLEHKENREFYYKKYGQSIVKIFGTSKKGVEPTFVEFLQYVANKHANADEHWRPYHTECAPCELNYNFVLKTESLNTELEQLLTELDLKKYLPDRSANINPQGHTDIQITKQYFSGVPRILLESIYKIYQRDFELFGYSPDTYFNMTI